jgi:hypothetical protein
VEADVRQFSKDDEGYVRWLAAHPSGFVLNTYAHVTASYLILHRASCRTVNRPLASDRSWTHAYGKACSDDRAEIESWALREVGKTVSPCGHCLPEVGAPASGAGKHLPSHAVGSRGPRSLDNPVAFDGVPVRVVIQRPMGLTGTAPPLVIEGAQWLSETFFLRDPSAIGANSYDAWIAETRVDPARRDRVVDGDVTAVNRTMAARTAHAAWAPLVASHDWSWLESIDTAWDLFETDPESWAAASVPDHLAEAFTATRRAGLHLAVITKVLHIKRPRLFPVLDSVVVSQVGAAISDDIGTWVTAMNHVRDVGRANLTSLHQVQAHLDAKGITGRSLVRILDGLLWVSSPGAGMFAQLDGWERVIRPASQR